MLATAVDGVLQLQSTVQGFLSERDDGKHCTCDISGCHWLQVSSSEKRWRENAFGERSLDYSPMITCFPSWLGAEVMWRGKSVLRMLKGSAEEGFSKATACGLQPHWKTAQHVIAKAFNITFSVASLM